jgi:hypothetical protein
LSPSGNSILYNGGFIDLSTDVYTGSTALRIYSTADNPNSVFRTVDFEVQSGATGYLSFWIKSNANVYVDYNIMNDGKFIWNNWNTISGNTNYQEVRINITGATFTKTGTATLWFKSPTSTFLVDKIGLYSGSTTNTPNGIPYPINGLKYYWTFNNSTIDRISGLDVPYANPNYSAGVIGNALINNNAGFYYKEITDATFYNHFLGKSSYTCSAWGYQVVINKLQLFIFNSGNFQFGFSNINTGNISISNRASGNNILHLIPVGFNPLNTWNHYVWRYDGSNNTISWFINGVYWHSIVDSTSWTAGQINKFCHCGLDGNGNGIDDWRLYNRALTDEEIMELYLYR